MTLLIQPKARRVVTFATPVAAMLLLTPGFGHAFEFNTGDEDFKLRWDNTVKYSNAFRVRQADSQLLDNINGDDGDRNFSRGLI